MPSPSRHFPDFPPTPTKTLSLLNSVIRSRSLAAGKQLHALLLTAGLLHRSPLPSHLASMYSLCGRPSDAHQLFDQIPHPTPILYNTLIQGHVNSHLPLAALALFSHMLSSGLRPDNFTYPFALKACGALLLPRAGIQIHSHVLSSGFASDEFVQNSLIAMYMTCGQPEPAASVFNLIERQAIVAWNTMISGYAQNGLSAQALAVFDRMMDDRVAVDQATVVSVLPVCAQLKDLPRGRCVHQLAEESDLRASVPVRNALVDMYAKCGRVEEARRVFDDGMCERDVITWTTMIGGYAANGFLMEAISLLHRMLLSGIRPNLVTMACLLSAFSGVSNLAHGKCVHGLCIRLCLSDDIVVETALINMYGKCGRMGFASMMFSRSSRKTPTWNAVISLNTHIGQIQEAIRHFKLMRAECVLPDLITIASVLPAYADTADLCQIENMHGYLMRTGFLQNIAATTGLIDAYSKVGCMDVARGLFEGLPIKDMVSWTAMIAGYGKHGNVQAAIELFEQMDAELEPNDVTFTSMLHTCSHTGLVEQGLKIFDRMCKSDRLSPNVDHYASVIDLLGRAGRFEEARAMIATMPFEANHVVWGALLGACVIHGNVEIAEMAVKHLFVLDPENTGNYVMLANIYAANGRWEEAEAVRTRLAERQLMKLPGCSLVEARNS